MKVLKIAEEKSRKLVVEEFKKNGISFKQLDDIILLESLRGIYKIIDKFDMSYELYNTELIMKKLKKTNFDILVEKIKESVKIHMDKWVLDFYNSWIDIQVQHSTYMENFASEKGIKGLYNCRYFEDFKNLEQYCLDNYWSKASLNICYAFSDEQSLQQIEDAGENKLDKIQKAVRKKNRS